MRGAGPALPEVAVTVPREIEICLVVRRPRDFQRIPALLRRLAETVSAPRLRRIEDAMLDTADLTLARVGVALRLRRERGAPAELTLKTLSPLRQGLAVRPELSEQLAGRAAAPLRGTCPGQAVAERVNRLIGRRRLGVRFRIRQERTVYEVQTSGGACLVVSADAVTLPGRPPRVAHGIEVEWRAGPVAELTRFSAALASALDLEPALESKFDAGLRAAGLERPVPCAPSPPRRFGGLPALMAHVIRKHLARLSHHRDGVLLDMDPEHVHAMRVACRRLRAALQMLVDTGEAIAPGPLSARLRRLGRHLGDVRDLDVHHGALEARIGRLPPDESRGLGGYADRLRRRRERAHARLLGELQSGRFDALQAGLAGLALELEAVDRPHGTSAAGRTGPVIRRLLKRVRRLGRALGPASADSDLHRLRIRCKKLRYACEFVQDAYGPAVAAFAARAADLQESLGIHQDLVVEESLLRRFLAGTAAKRRPAVARAAGRMLAELAAEREDARRAGVKAWRRFDRRKARRQLVGALRDARV